MANRISFESVSDYLEKNIVVKKTVQKVIENLRANYQVFKTVTDQDLVALSSIFGDTLKKALEIVEENKVAYYHTKTSNIGIYQIEGSSCKNYTIYPSVNYCPCHSYKYQVSGGSQSMCIHVLATVIADATSKRQSIEITDEHFRDLILASDSQIIKMNERKDWKNQNIYLQELAYPPSTMPFFGPNNWVHVPPQTMPWGTPAVSQPSIVRFTAGDSCGYQTSVKRKSKPSSDVLPIKILVTEEKMAAHMKGLHISDVDVEPEDISTSMNCNEETMESEKLPKLVISDEIKNMKTDLILPESILRRLEKPEMALVLWQPPPSELGRLKEMSKASKSKEEEERENLLEEDKTMDIEIKEEKNMDLTMEEEMENNNLNSTFRPINPVPMPVPTPTQYIQPIPQFHGYSPFQKSSTFYN